jgi:hypothetical protein
MLLARMQARDLKVELFEQATQEELQDELQAWLSGRTEEAIVGISFESGESGAYRAQVLYTE